MTRDLSDSPTSRTEPVRKCGTASLDQGNTYFSLGGEGICFSGSNQISDYIGGGESQSCSDGRGNYFGGQFVMDVYHIDDAIAFQDSSSACVACGKDYCSEPDLQSNWRLMCSVSSTHHTLPTVAIINFYFLSSGKFKYGTFLRAMILMTGAIPFRLHPLHIRRTHNNAMLL